MHRRNLSLSLLLVSPGGLPMNTSLLAARRESNSLSSLLPRSLLVLGLPLAVGSATALAAMEDRAARNLFDYVELERLNRMRFLWAQDYRRAEDQEDRCRAERVLLLPVHKVQQTGPSTNAGHRSRSIGSKWSFEIGSLQSSCRPMCLTEQGMKTPNWLPGCLNFRKRFARNGLRRIMPKSARSLKSSG